MLFGVVFDVYDTVVYNMHVVMIPWMGIFIIAAMFFGVYKLAKEPEDVHPHLPLTLLLLSALQIVSILLCIPFNLSTPPNYSENNIQQTNNTQYHKGSLHSHFHFNTMDFWTPISIERSIWNHCSSFMSQNVHQICL